jgi:hypothetical protein
VRVIVFATSGDDALTSSRWIAEQNVQRLRQELAAHVDVVLDAEATRASLESALANGADGLATFSHGQDDARDRRTGEFLPTALLASDGSRALDRKNLHLTQGMWVHAFACHSGRQLPGLAQAVGCLCFVGYDFAIRFDWSPAEIPEPIRPAFAALVSEVTIQLARGERSRRRLRQAIAPHQAEVIAWCDAHPEQARGLDVTALQISRLVCPPHEVDETLGSSSD